LAVLYSPLKEMPVFSEYSVLACGSLLPKTKSMSDIERTGM